jgi:outer membrane protein assembly factor BamB
LKSECSAYETAFHVHFKEAAKLASMPSMTTDDFINLLEQRQLAPAGIARQLRAKAAQGDQRINPKSILKYLVKKEIVTRAQAKELLETTLIVSDNAESSILGLTPLIDVPDSRSAKPSKSPTPVDSTPATPTTRRSKPPTSQNPQPPLEEPVLLEPFSPFGTAAEVGGAADFDPFSSAETMHDPLESDEASSGGSKRKGASRRKRSGKDRGKSEWDSPLLLLGGTGLAVLIVAGVVLYWLLNRENSDALLKEANGLFEGGSYTQAISKYQSFVENYPSHQDFSQAKVRLGMAELWRDTERTTDFKGALATAQRVIPQIEDEQAFAADAGDGDGLSQAKRELSSLLTTIATGLAAQAEASQDSEVVQERIEQINTALALTANTKYVPQRFRLDSELNAVRDTLERVKLRQKRETDLTAGLAMMDAAIGEGDTAAAFAVRSELIKQYPVLLENKALGEKVLRIADAERSLVKFVEARQPALTEPTRSGVVAELALADRGGESADVTGSIVVCADGGVYALNAVDGSLLWRRFVGLEANVYPFVLANGDIVTADVGQKELICLNAQSGKLVWRLPLEGKLATPSLTGGRLLVPSDAGKLFVIEQASGELLGHVPFSQALRLPAAVSEQGDRVYVLGDHSNLYTLSGDSLACLGVHYLGHSAGSITAPPALALNKVIVAHNSGAETSRIRALALNDEGVVANEVASHRMSGLVITPLQVAARRVAAVTTLGQAVVFEASGGNDESALTILAGREPQNRDPLAQFALLHEGHLWLAGRQMTKLAILPTGNQLPVRALERDYRGDAFDYPLQAAGDLVIHLRRPASQAGAIVAAMHAEAGPTWETRIAVPPAGPPAVDASGLRITAGAASGAVFLLDREAMARRVQNDAERLSGTQADAAVMTDSLALAQGSLILGGVGTSKLLLFRPDDPRQSLKAVELTGPLSCQPVAWRNGFVSAANVGQVTLHNADDGSPLATPFQPELTPGQKYNWLRPATIGTGVESQLVVSDGGAKLYLLSVEPQPQPHLKAVATVDVGASPLTTPLAVVGNQVFAGNEAGQLARYALPELTAGAPIGLGGRVSWGPHVAGEGVLVGVESGELLMVSGDGAVRWRHPLKHGTPGGAPLTDGENAFLLFPAAGLARIALADGAEGAFAELGQPAVAGPVAFGPRLVVSAPDGTLLIVNRP